MVLDWSKDSSSGGCRGLARASLSDGVSYMNCAGIFYMPFYSGGALMYQVANP
jgi:hypothetical protein